MYSVQGATVSVPLESGHPPIQVSSLRTVLSFVYHGTASSHSDRAGASVSHGGGLTHHSAVPSVSMSDSCRQPRPQRHKVLRSSRWSFLWQWVHGQGRPEAIPVLRGLPRLLPGASSPPSPFSCRPWPPVLPEPLQVSRPEWHGGDHAGGGAGKASLFHCLMGSGVGWIPNPE